MSEITWGQLLEAEREALREIIRRDGVIPSTDVWLAIRDKRLVHWVGGVIKLTDLGRTVLAQATSRDPQPATSEPAAVGGAEGWYYSSVVQWVPEYSTEKINGYDGPFPTWQLALEALFKEVGDDIDSFRADLSRMQKQITAAESEKRALAEALEPFARTYQVFSERPNLGVTFSNWLKDHLNNNKSAFNRHARMWFMQADAVLANDHTVVGGTGADGNGKQ